MKLILKNTEPLYKEATKLSPKALQVYLVLWQSAVLDVRYDKNLKKEWKHRADKGGTTEWTIKGIAGHIGSKRETVSKAIALLLDDGLITVAGYRRSTYGTKHTVFRVTHPEEIENVREAISVMGKPSSTWKAQMKPTKNNYEPDHISDDGCDFKVEPYDWSWYDAHYPECVEELKQKVHFNMHTTDWFSHIFNKGHLYRELGLPV